MLNVEFIGANDLIQELNDAVAQCTPRRIGDSVKHCLSRLINEDRIDLPASVLVSGEHSYGRHLLYRNEEQGYVVVAMAWGPGQGTPLHDHAGVWCVEGVWRGCLEVVQYEVEERAGNRFRFLRRPPVVAGPGSAGALIPPYEYHTLTNALRRETTVTLHVYGRDLRSCSVFEPEHDGWFKRHTKDLSYS